jgi:DNA-binding transcriptional LysR family regulator
MEAFAEIMRTGSATAAAKVLGLSQSAVSRLLHQLEGEVGFELFYRDRGRLVPTKDGIVLADEVELALAGVARVAGLVDDINGSAVGEIRLIAPPSFAEAVIPPIVAEFIRLHPGVRVSIDSRSIATTKNMVITRVADCAFMRLPGDSDELRADRLVTSKTICVIPKCNPLAKLDSLSPETIGNAPLVALGVGSVWGRQIEEAFASRGCKQTIAVSTHTISSACALARQGLGIAIANELLASAYLGPDVVTVPFEPTIIHEYALVTPAHSPVPRLVAEFQRVASAYFEARKEAGFKA